MNPADIQKPAAPEPRAMDDHSLVTKATTACAPPVKCGRPGTPLPGLNAWVAASVECFGGLSLRAGFASRLRAITLSITMIVAYLTADNAALKSIFSETGKFTLATPLLFLLTVLVVLASRRGVFPADRLLTRRLSQIPVNIKG